MKYKLNITNIKVQTNAEILKADYVRLTKTCFSCLFINKQKTSFMEAPMSNTICKKLEGRDHALHFYKHSSLSIIKY